MDHAGMAQDRRDLEAYRRGDQDKQQRNDLIGTIGRLTKQIDFLNREVEHWKNKHCANCECDSQQWENKYYAGLSQRIAERKNLG